MDRTATGRRARAKWPLSLAVIRAIFGTMLVGDNSACSLPNTASTDRRRWSEGLLAHALTASRIWRRRSAALAANGC